MQSADTSYLTRPAAFGPDKVDEEGLWGRLLPIRLFYGTRNTDGIVPNLGCPAGTSESDKSHSPSFGGLFGTSDKPRRPPKNWIALVERGECSFTDKVRLAQELGAIAVVVEDAKYEYDEDSKLERLMSLRDIPWDNDELDQGETRPITMYPDGDADDIKIPSCFVIRSSYLELLELVHESLSAPKGLFGRSEEGLEVGLFLDASLPDLSAIDLGMLFLFLPSILTILFVIVQHIKTVIKQYRERASTNAVRNLPCYEWHADRPWELLATPSHAEPPPKGAGVFAWTSYYASRVYDRLWRLVARRAQGEYAPLTSEPQTGAEAAVALEEQPEQAPGPRPAPVAPAADSSARDVRRYTQDVCPICLCEFMEGYVIARLTQGSRACSALWSRLSPRRSVRMM